MRAQAKKPGAPHTADYTTIPLFVPAHSFDPGCLTSLSLTDDEVHVWRAWLDELPQSKDVLSTDELQRAARFHFDKDRRHFIAGRAWLRTLLARYLNTDAARLQFVYAARGKPALVDGSGGHLRFNLAHSHGLALVAMTKRREIGVDVECISASVAGPEIAERFFSAAEVIALRSLPVEQQQEAFFAGWTRKEAYIKAIGVGLFAALDRFTVSLTPGAPAALLEVADDPREAARWTMRELHPGDGYAAAVAVEGRDWRWCCFDWQPPSVT
ncbi:MAG: 4'-phosphopantetheinyl transferase superfamily protein [Burkholderiales bacterium]|nr:4'-phosphopantetheinyl transferase superfamily protein [Burkholderiales bacterium]